MDSNQYELVFANKAYFAKFYPMNYKSKARNDLKLFCQGFGVSKKLTSDSSKERACEGATCMK